MPSLILSNPLGADDAQRIGGLEPREYLVGEVISVNDFIFTTLIRTGYGLPYGDVTDILIIGDGSPNELTGVDGQWYLDQQNEVLWGPKTGGLWPSQPIRPDRGISQFQIDAQGRLVVTYSTGNQVDLGLVVGQGYGGGFITGPVDPNQPLNLQITSNWGLRDDGTVYYDTDGALPAEAALLVPDPETGTLGLFRPGAPYATMLPERIRDLVADVGGVVYAELAARFATDARMDAAEAGVAAAATKVYVDAQDALKIPLTQRGAANGVATLDAGGKVPQAQIPAVALVEFLGAVASQAAMLALTGQRGDWCTRTDLGTDWQLIADDPTQLASWRAMTDPASPVSSVAGRTGAVTISSADITDATAAATANTVAKRDAAGRLAVATPSVAGDAATKGYTDGQDVIYRRITPRSVAANLTLALTDEGSAIYTPTAQSAAVAVTVPTDATVAFPVGSWVDVVRTGSGALTLAAAGGVTLLYAAGKTLAVAAGGRVRLLKLAANLWEAFGDLTADLFPIAAMRATAVNGTFAATWIDIPFHVADIDSHGGWVNGANPHRWTCPTGQGGTYAIEGSANMMATANGPWLGARLMKNATIVQGWGAAGQEGATNGRGARPTGRHLVTLAATDYVTLQGYCGVAGWSTNIDATDGAGSWMTVERIR